MPAPGLGAPEHFNSLGSAAALSIGIGLQNLPEGAAISLPFRRRTEPIAGILVGASFGAIYGQIAGAFYGEEGMPEEWVKRLAWADRIS
ncbi:MAG: hypothetical protein LC126_24045 [Bryobacterales bacterium]|nr:hypothetical protein [Bryobacterales bacterium]